MATQRNKYSLYERSVQSPAENDAFFATVFKELRGRAAVSLREDFCGSFLQALTWVRRGPSRTAIAVDLDLEPLAYGRRRLARSSRSQRRRLRVLRQNVLKVTRPRVDLTVALNYSFYVFKRWSELLAYCRSSRRSLNRDGLLLLEMVGGPGFIEKLMETRRIRGRGSSWFTVVWDQKSFDPISREGLYAIHFKFPDGPRMRDAFTYDWRVWTIPEVRTALELSGFGRTLVYWEQNDDRGRGTEVYTVQERADNDYAWTCYVVGLV
ncbi:MAG TPA: hypothetical protein VGB99_06150 [Acidobacteriota bacterium]